MEKFKGKDLLEQLLAEMTTEFPGLSQVVIEERDTFLAHSLKMAAEPIHAPNEPKGNQSNTTRMSNIWMDQDFYNVKWISASIIQIKA